MSPQTRRGRAAPASHRRSSSKVPADAQHRPEVENEPETEGPVAARHHTSTPGVRRRGVARVRRSSMLRNVYAYVKVYIPLFLAFVVLFAGVWAYISFGPHTPTPQENWSTIEKQWKPKVDADRNLVNAAAINSPAQQSAYKALADDITSWVTPLAKVTDWSVAGASPGANEATSADVATFISDGGAEAGILLQASAATSPDALLALAQSIGDNDSLFWSDYERVRGDLFPGSAQPSAVPTIALPSGSLSPSESPGASGSPSASGSPAAGPGASAVPSGSPGPS